jgi:hypothetical protein
MRRNVAGIEVQHTSVLSFFLEQGEEFLREILSPSIRFGGVECVHRRTVVGTKLAHDFG